MITKQVPLQAIDLVSEARHKCLDADILVDALVASTPCTADDRTLALIELLARSVKEAREAVERACRALS